MVRREGLYDGKVLFGSPLCFKKGAVSLRSLSTDKFRASGRYRRAREEGGARPRTLLLLRLSLSPITHRINAVPGAS